MDAASIVHHLPLEKQNDKIMVTNNKNEQMTSSVLSGTSSLTSPGDSGIQFLDSESEILSVTSTCTIGYDTEIIPTTHNCENIATFKSQNCKRANFLNDENKKICFKHISHKNDTCKIDSDLYFKSVQCFQNRSDITSCDVVGESLGNSALSSLLDFTKCKKKNELSEIRPGMHLLTKLQVGKDAFEYLDDTLLIDKKPANVKEQKVETKLPYEELKLLVDENKVQSDEEQIVFRRQRKKKSRSDTPKKRVSFHEDILNTTKIDDVHINHGFITRDPNESIDFLYRNHVTNDETVGCRYSWAAEGDVPYQQKHNDNRQVHSEIYIHKERCPSTSSSSSTSISSSTEFDSTENFDSEEALTKNVPEPRLPKSSCLKKTKRKNYINTNIVQESTNLKKKKNDSALFGSLKNILQFSSSMPLTERGVPEGQEDIVHSSSYDNGNFLINAHLYKKPNEKNKGANICGQKDSASSEGVLKYSGTKTTTQPNIILFNNNIYEHKGINCSYEYDVLRKNLEYKKEFKGLSVYQTLKKLFSKKCIQNPNTTIKPEPHTVPNNPVESITFNNEFELKNSLSDATEDSITKKINWSDNDPVVDFSEHHNTRHLDSPRRKVTKNNHFSVHHFKTEHSTSAKLEYVLSTKDLHGLKPSKMSLIDRFLRSFATKNVSMVKQKKHDKAQYLALYIKGSNSYNIRYNNDDINKQIEQEIFKNKINKTSLDESRCNNLIVKFKNEISKSATEKLIKAFPVHSSYTECGASRPLIFIISNLNLYLVGFKKNNSFYAYFELAHKQLNVILIGLNSQTVYFSNRDYTSQCMIITGCSEITNNIIGHLEMAVRRNINKSELPTVKYLSMDDMSNLRRTIYNQTTVEKDEEYLYYAIVHFEDFNSVMSEFSFGPNKEGPLMFKLEHSSRWETAYFILKSGVLYMLSSSSYRVPLRVFPLINGSCRGAERIFNHPRPHTFQLIIEDSTILLAAPDEYVASEWLQALVHAANTTCAQDGKSLLKSSSLIMTSSHILTIQESLPSIKHLNDHEIHKQHLHIKEAQVLSCALISDITALRLPSSEQSWCIMEFSCQEVLESSGDWILYFSTNVELENFISTLEMLWVFNNKNRDSFPLSTVPETFPVNRRCIESYKTIQNAWASVPLCLQNC